MGEIRGAVQGVDDPPIGRIAVFAVAFFCEDGVSEVGAFYSVNDQGFAGAIDFSDQVDRGALGVDG